MSIERSYSLFNDHPRLELVLLENYSNEPFITADQPMINLAAKFKRLEAPLTLEVSWANIACPPSKNIIHSAKVASFPGVPVNLAFISITTALTVRGCAIA